MRRVAGYDLLDLLGRGAMGSVHRARRSVDGREVALKVVSTATPKNAARLLREAELARRLDHPGVVKVLDAGGEGPLTFVAFELVTGARPLNEVAPELDLRGRVTLVRDAARALGHAHARGVVHRDVKPANVLVDPVGCVRLTDFGVGLADDLARLTVSGTLVGTPVYMAPEQATGERDRIGPPTDVWALGVVLHELLTGEHPFFADEPPPSLAALLHAITRERPRALRDVDPTLPPALDAVVARALARDPAERFPDGEAMASALDAALAALPRGRRRRLRGTNRTAVAAATSALLVLGAGAAAWWVARRWRASALRDEGAQLLAAGDAAASVSALRAAEALRPDAAAGQLPLALAELARASLARGDLEQAARLVDEAGSAPGAAAVRVELALARGDVDAAAALAQAAGPAVAAPVARALVERASARAADRPLAAATDLQSALRLDPGSVGADPAQRVAFHHVGVDDWSALEAALALADDDVAAAAWRLLSERCAQQQRAERSWSAAERLLARARSPLQRAEAQYWLGRRDDARRELAPLVDDPQLGVAARVMLVSLRQDELNELGCTAEQRRELSALFGELLARDPSSIRAHLRRGLALVEVGDPAGREHLARACELAAWHERAHCQQLAGYGALRFGDTDGALRAFDQSLAADPDGLEARKQRGIMRNAVGDLAGAKDDLERLVANVPAYADAQVWALLLELRTLALDVPGTRAAGDRLRALRRDSPDVRVFVALSLVEVGDLHGGEDLLVDVPEDARLQPALRGTAACLRARLRAELQSDGALEDAALARRLGPDELPAQIASAFAHLAAGQLERGLELAEAAAQRARAADVLANARVARAWALVALERDLARAEEDASSGVAEHGAPQTIALAVRALARRARGDLDGARADARAVLARLGAVCPDAWTVRVSREVLGE